MPPKIKNTFSILPETDAGLRQLCELTHRTYQGDMIDSLVDEELKRRGLGRGLEDLPGSVIEKITVNSDGHK